MLDYEPVAIPIVEGINVTTRARLLQPQALLEAENVRFPTGSGAVKRRGHTGARARSTKPIPEGVTLPLQAPPVAFEPYSTGDRGLPSDWLFGWGVVTEIQRSASEDAVRLATSPHPDASLFFGAAQRDDESVLWNGHQFLSRTDAGALPTVESAVMPSLRSAPIAKTNQSQTRPDVADTGTIRVAAWIDGATGQAWYSVINSASGAAIVQPARLFESDNDPQYIRCIPVGDWIHILIADDNSETLIVKSVHESTPLDLTTRSFGDCRKYFDAFKISETLWLVARNVDNLSVVLSYHQADGNNADIETPTITPVLGVTPTTLYTVAVAVHADSGNTALVFRAAVGGTTSVYGRIYDSTGAASGTPTTNFGAVDSNHLRVAVAPKYIYDSNDQPLFDVYWDDDPNSFASGIEGAIYASRFSDVSSDELYTISRRHYLLSSQAFRVGDRTFIWASRRSGLQNVWRLLDEDLRPVGVHSYATANTPSVTDFPALASVNWSGEAPVKDILVYHTALGFKVRVETERDPADEAGTNLPVVFAEPSISFIELEFLPPLRGVQAGRCTYFAGAQLWVYDGRDLAEAGFHVAPEVTAVAGTGSGGGLTTDGNYIWRIDLCHRNAQNEEVRSHSFFTDQVTLAAGQKAQITLEPVLTRRSDSYFLIFRNEHNGTLWYLVSSRDPGSDQYVANDIDGAGITFLDDGLDTPTDAELLTQELHPGNAGLNWIEPVAAPACEVIAAGNNRLWVAGGELSPGAVAPSRYFEVGETPAFNPALWLQVDRSAEPVTAIGFTGELAAVFQRESIYVIDGDGPDNVRNGAWPDAKLAPGDSKLGAVSQEGMTRVNNGLAFKSAAGFRMIGPSGAVAPMGLPVDELAKTFSVSGVHVSGQDQEVRWYSRDNGVIVFNYQYGAWSRWTVNAAGVARNPTTNLAVLASPDGYLLEETDDLYQDNGSPYRLRVRTSWLRAGTLGGFQAVRRIGALGTAAADHSMHVEVFYDERDFAEERFYWEFPLDAANPSWNPDTFGSETFGAGVFGDDVAGSSPHEIRDRVWEWQRMPCRRKCSVISFAIDDDYTDGDSFILTAVTLEIGLKPGLNKTPRRAGRGENTHGAADIGNGR